MGTWRVKIKQLIFLAKRSELSEVIAKGISLDGREDQLFFSISQGEVTLWINDCPHNHRPLEYQKDKFLSADGGHIVCYAHSAHFDKVTGECYAGPCKGKSLKKLPHVEQDQKLYVEANVLKEIGY